MDSVSHYNLIFSSYKYNHLPSYKSLYNKMFYQRLTKQRLLTLQRLYSLRYTYTEIVHFVIILVWIKDCAGRARNENVISDELLDFVYFNRSRNRQG